MTYIKETIQGLYSLKTYLASKAIEEHDPARESLIGMQKVVDSAVNLLKEKEGVEPEVEVLNEIDCLYRCPKCHKCFFYEKQKYCDQCGQAVKWNDT